MDYRIQCTTLATPLTLTRILLLSCLGRNLMPVHRGIAHSAKLMRRRPNPSAIPARHACVDVRAVQFTAWVSQADISV